MGEHPVQWGIWQESAYYIMLVYWTSLGCQRDLYVRTFPAVVREDVERTGPACKPKHCVGGGGGGGFGF